MASARLVSLLIFAILSTAAATSYADVVKNVRLDSDPPGASVALLVGTKHEIIGKTPINYRAEFHSEMSVLRLLFELPGYLPQSIELAASQNHASIKFERRKIAATPASITDSNLRSIQESISPIIERVLPGLLKTSSDSTIDVDGLVRVDRIDGQNYLVVPISIANKELDRAGAERWWNEAGHHIITGLDSNLSGLTRIAGIVLVLHGSAVQHQFGVSSHIENTVEMECVAGTDYRQQLCMYNEYCSSGSGYKTVAVYNPCQTRVPVTKSTLKVDPSASTIQSHASIYYVAAYDAAGKPMDRSFAKIGVLQVSAGDKQIYAQGVVPRGLATIHTFKK
jgi:hypothetical protein